MNYFKNLKTTYSLFLNDFYFIPDEVIITTVCFYM